jgi:hypothetical protein
VRRESDIGQQFIELICGMGRQATEDILKVREGIDRGVPAGAGQRVENRRGSAAPVTSEEGPITALGTRRTPRSPRPPSRRGQPPATDRLAE